MTLDNKLRLATPATLLLISGLLYRLQPAPTVVPVPAAAAAVTYEY
jgi:hypothetical protein